MGLPVAIHREERKHGSGAENRGFLVDKEIEETAFILERINR